MREKQIENKIKSYLSSRNCWCVKYYANSHTKSGIPDILACINGRFVAIEVKSDIGTTSVLQEYNLNYIKMSGGIGLVVRPQNFDEFKELIEELLHDKPISIPKRLLKKSK